MKELKRTYFKILLILGVFLPLGIFVCVFIEVLLERCFEKDIINLFPINVCICLGRTIWLGLKIAVRRYEILTEEELNSFNVKMFFWMIPFEAMMIIVCLTMFYG